MGDVGGERRDVEVHLHLAAGIEGDRVVGRDVDRQRDLGRIGDGHDAFAHLDRPAAPFLGIGKQRDAVGRRLQPQAFQQFDEIGHLGGALAHPRIEQLQFGLRGIVGEGLARRTGEVGAGDVEKTVKSSGIVTQSQHPDKRIVRASQSLGKINKVLRR